MKFYCSSPSHVDSGAWIIRPFHMEAQIMSSPDISNLLQASVIILLRQNTFIKSKWMRTETMFPVLNYHLIFFNSQTFARICKDVNQTLFQSWKREYSKCMYSILDSKLNNWVSRFYHLKPILQLGLIESTVITISQHLMQWIHTSIIYTVQPK